MKVRYGIITTFFLFPGFIPATQAGWVNFKFNELCNVYWQYQGPIKLGFDKSGLDIEDGDSTSVDVPVNVFCLGRPDDLYYSDASFSMAVSNVSPKPWFGNNLVLTNKNRVYTSRHYQIQANLCAGAATGEISQLCVNTIGTPTSYVFPGSGNQRELVDSILGPASDQSTTADKDLCRSHPQDCSYSYGFFHLGAEDHPYRLQAHLVIPRQEQIAPGSYDGSYTILLNGKLKGKSIFGVIPLVGMNITNVQQPLEFKLDVSSACQVTPPADISLPEQIFSGKSETQDATAHVRCTFGTPFTVTFKGQNTDNTGMEHLAVSAGKNKIPYKILDGDGVPWEPLGKKLTGTSENEAIKFKIKTLSGENQPAGTYEDTMTMTVSYTEGT